VQVTVLVKPISADEYDDAVRRSPEACVPHVMGDRRPGRQLLDPHVFAADYRRTIANIGSDPEDEELLRSVAAFSIS
jgi:hypothetical protein